jgi:hypothetical protein
VSIYFNSCSMSENNVMVHRTPFHNNNLFVWCFLFYLHHNCCIFFESMVLVLVWTEGQEDKLRHGVCFCLFVSHRPIKLSVSPAIWQLFQPWDIQGICKVLILCFLFVNFTHLRLRCMLQFLYFISVDALHWTFPFYTIT